jgi:hypothetical protein
LKFFLKAAKYLNRSYNIECDPLVKGNLPP